MTIPELTFQLDVNGTAEFEELSDWFQKLWTDLNIKWLPSGTGVTSENWIEVSRNRDYDPSLIDSDEGWFHYPYTITVYTRKNPSPTMADFSKQVAFARLLKARLEERGCKIKIHAEFETLVIDPTAFPFSTDDQGIR